MKITKTALLILLFFGILIFSIIVDDNQIQLSSEYYYEKLNSDHTATIYAYWILGFLSLCLLELFRKKLHFIIFNICFGIVIISNIYSMIFIINSKDYRLILAPIIFLVLSAIVLFNIPKPEKINKNPRIWIFALMLFTYILINMILIFSYEQKINSIMNVHKIENKRYETK